MIGTEAALVLGYHTLSSTWDNSVAVRPDAFRSQLELLLASGYRSVTFSEAVETSSHHRTVAVTFDDAFLAVHQIALPLLRELGMVGTLFAPTAFVASGVALRWDGYDALDPRIASREMAPLSWDHLRDLAEHGWEIGSHTRVHPHLPRLDQAALLEELRASREECTAGTGLACTAVAYPYGEVDQRVRDAAEAAGFRAGAALGPQWRRGDPMWWPRTGVYRGDDLGRFRLKLNGVVRSRGFAVGITTARRLVGAHD